MVAAENVAVNARRLEAVVQTLGGNEVVYAPPGVLFACFEAITPPRVGPFCVGIEETEGVCKSTFEQFGELRAFLIGKSGILAIRLRVFQVNFAVCHIQVAAHHDRLLRVECQKIVTERVVPRHSIIQAAQTVLRVGHIRRNEIEIFKFQGHSTAFVVVFVNSQAVSYTQRADARKNSGSGIAFLFGVVQ